ncbi:amino acid permease [Priestia megaterium]|uniref:amino acid permease n=1 Tax=Priestia megaterium TaxID=1404 RepID=UPI003009F10F
MIEGQQQTNELKKTMKSRHLFMISLGGVIGTGFFLGTGYTISQAGAIGAILSFIVGGFIMYLTMLCLGELAVAMPVSGSFQTYTTKFIGPGVGFAFGWLYWLGWAVTVALEFLSAGQLMQRWFPDVSVWIWSALFALLLFGLNATSVRFFGETEFWFSSIKVLTIIVFIILGAAAMFGFIPLSGHEKAPMLSHFTGEGGLFPNGLMPVLITMVSVSFAFSGTELIGITAGETEDPEKNIPRAIKNIIWRTFFFFIGAMFVLSGLISWKQAGVLESPFVTVFDQIGIPYAADIMNLVILTALLSNANAGLYACSRMLWSLSDQKMVSTWLGKVTSKGVPFNSLLISMGVACLSLLSSVVAPTTVYLVLVSISGFAVVAVWMAIAASHFMFRRRYIKEGNDVSKLVYKAPLYPIVPILAFVLCFAACVGLAFDKSQRIALYCGIPFVLFCYLFYYLKNKKGNRKNESQPIAK